MKEFKERFIQIPDANDPNRQKLVQIDYIVEVDYFKDEGRLVLTLVNGGSILLFKNQGSERIYQLLCRHSFFY